MTFKLIASITAVVSDERQNMICSTLYLTYILVTIILGLCGKASKPFLETESIHNNANIKISTSVFVAFK